jgi:chromosome segregation ATPase
VIAAFINRQHTVDQRRLTITTSPQKCAELSSELTMAKGDLGKLETAEGEVRTDIDQVQEEASDGRITPQQAEAPIGQLQSELADLDSAQQSLDETIAALQAQFVAHCA